MSRGRKHFSAGASRRAKLSLTRWLGVLIVSALALALCAATLTLVQPATAYTPANLEPALGEDYTAGHAAAVQVKRDKGQTADPVPGEKFTYKYSYQLQNLPKEQPPNTKTVIRFNTSAAAPFMKFVENRNPRFAVKPKLNNLDIEDIKCNGTRTSCSATVDTSKLKAGQSFTLTVDVDAKVREDADPATLVVGSAEIATDYAADINLIPTGLKYFEPDSDVQRCEGVFNFQWKAVHGQWLADLKFADAEGKGKVILDPKPLSKKDQKNQIIIQDASGRDITDQFLNPPDYTYKLDDPSRPYAGDKDPLVVNNPKAKWLQSANWPLDPSTFTGKKWLPDGATVTVRKHGRYTACLGPTGSALDLDTTRPVLAVLSSARPFFKVDASASTFFVLPGKPPKLLACQEKIWFGRENYKSNSTTLGLGYIDTQKQTFTAHRIGPILFDGSPAEPGSIAISEKEPNRIYYIAYQSKGIIPIGLGYKDLTDGTFHKVDFSSYGLKPTFGKGNKRTTIGFDNRGLLWAVEGNDNGTGVLAKAYSINVFENNPQWRWRGDIQQPTGKYTPRDLVFDAAGSMLLITDGGAGSGFGSFKNAVLEKIDADIIEQTLATGKAFNVGPGLLQQKLHHTNIAGTSGGQWNALAWAADGTLYAQNTDSGLYRLSYRNGYSTIDGVSAQPVRLTSKDGEAHKHLVDFGSCNYGEPVIPPKEPKFVLSKAVVDPVTGAAAEPGANAEHNIPFDASGKVTVKYFVTVANVGEQSGSYQAITDQVRLPGAFSIDQIRYRKKQGPNPRWTVAASADNTPGGIGNSHKFILSNGGEVLKPRELRAWEIEIDAHFDAAKVNWQKAKTCSGQGVTTYAGGLFNKVDMQGDSDGVKNNRACVGITPPGQGRIILIKDITDAQRQPVAETANDASYFELQAKGLQNTANSSIEVKGTSQRSGDEAANMQVPAGRYQLSETLLANYKQAGEDYQNLGWKCTKPGKGAAAVAVPVTAGNTIEVAAEEQVTCRIANYRPQVPTRISVIKIADHPVSAANPHIGVKAEPNTDRNDKWVLRYTIRIKNEGEQIANTGEIREHFIVPQGLKWSFGSSPFMRVKPVPAGVEIVQPTSAELPSGCFAWNFNLVCNYSPVPSPAHLANTLLLKSIKNLQPGQYVDIEVGLPLEADQSAAPNGGTVYDQYADQLRECEAGEKAGKHYAKATKGVVNSVSLQNEDTDYSVIHAEDNRACIPVDVPVRDLPGLPLTGGASAFSYYFYGLPLLSIALLVAVGYRLRKAAAIRRTI